MLKLWRGIVFLLVQIASIIKCACWCFVLYFLELFAKCQVLWWEISGGGRGSQISSANKVLYSSEAEGGEGRNAAKISPTFLLFFFFYKDKCFNYISALKKKLLLQTAPHLDRSTLCWESGEATKKGKFTRKCFWTHHFIIAACQHEHKRLWVTVVLLFSLFISRNLLDKDTFSKSDPCEYVVYLSVFERLCPFVIPVLILHSFKTAVFCLALF